MAGLLADLFRFWALFYWNGRSYVRLRHSPLTDFTVLDALGKFPVAVQPRLAPLIWPNLAFPAALAVGVTMLAGAAFDISPPIGWLDLAAGGLHAAALDWSLVAEIAHLQSLRV